MRNSREADPVSRGQTTFALAKASGSSDSAGGNGVTAVREPEGLHGGAAAGGQPIGETQTVVATAAVVPHIEERTALLYVAASRSAGQTVAGAASVTAAGGAHRQASPSAAKIEAAAHDAVLRQEAGTSPLRQEWSVNREGPQAPPLLSRFAARHAGIG